MKTLCRGALFGAFSMIVWGQAAKPNIDSVFPSAPYPIADRFDFQINGSNFDPDPTKDIVNLAGPGDISFRHREAPGGCSQYLRNASELPCLEAANDGRRLSIFGYVRPYAYQGPITVRVVANGVSSDSKSFTLSRVDYRIVISLAFAVFALLMLLIYQLVARGIRPYRIAGQSFSPLAAFVLDKDTDSYSLSKFQLLALSLVLFFSYIYVFLCRALVQWNFSFPDVPDNYPTLLAISAGTTAVAAGMGTMRPKGAGPVMPSPADFISNGGMVVPDRFQFFVWTMIACLGFIALVLMQDPATIQGFPAFPNGLLYVMGVSAAGYLGGKIARNPGPILETVAVTANGADLSVTLTGTNLDKKARFLIDGVGQTPSNGVAGEPQNGAPQDYCSHLEFKLERAAGFATGDHTLEILNADGLGAQQTFTGSPMLITPPAVVQAGQGPVTIVLTIQNYRDGSTVRWQAPGATAAADLPQPVSKSPGQVAVTLEPGNQKGTGTLTFLTLIGATETTPLVVV